MSGDNIEKFARVAQVGASLMPYGQPVSIAIDGSLALWEGGKGRAELAKILTKENLDSAAASNPALKRKLDDIGEKTTAAIRKSVINAGSSAVGFAAGSATPLGIVGGIIGSIVGSTAANMADDALFYVESNDAYSIKSNIDEDLKNGKKVSEVKIFALLASSLPNTQLNVLNEKLNKITDGKVTTISQAIKENKLQELEKLMNAPGTNDFDPGIDDMIRAYTGLNRKPQENSTSVPQTSAASEFAEMVNSGMDTSLLMRTDWLINVSGMMNKNNVMQGIEVTEPDGSPLPTMAESGIRHPASRKTTSRDPQIA